LIGQARPLNLSPEKAAVRNLSSVRLSLEKMAEKTIQKQVNLPSGMLRSNIEIAGPMSIDLNRVFLEEFHKIYHNQQDAEEKVEG